jgi:hypothetical protein
LHTGSESLNTGTVNKSRYTYELINTKRQARKLSAGPNGGVQTVHRRSARCLLDSCAEMIFKPNFDQLTVVADLSLARMRPDFIANRIGVPVGDLIG